MVVPCTAWRITGSKVEIINKAAYANVPYYRRAFRERKLMPDDIKTKEDLHKLPILTKDIIRKRFSDLKAVNFDSWKPWLSKTGGSTGEPLKFYITKTNISVGWACNFRGWEWAGYKLGDRCVTLGGSSIVPTQKPRFSKRLRYVMERNLPLSAVSMNKKVMNQYVEKIREFKPKFIREYPSAMYVFAEHLKEAGIDDIKTNAIFTTAEVLYPIQRKAIENQFGCRVFDGYGARDGGPNAMECSEHRGLHVSVESVVIEFAKDDETVSSGESGKMLCTDLFNYAMPFIRYAVGDVGTPTDELCQCGRGLPLIKSIEGRTTDIIEFGNGTVLSGPAFTLLFKEFDIEQYQIVQTARNRLLIKIVKGIKYTEKDTNYILDIIRRHVGEDVKVNLKIVDDIPTTKSEKRRFFISKVSNKWR
jgi:phenylacetate-CoA ligase